MSDVRVPTTPDQALNAYLRWVSKQLADLQAQLASVEVVAVEDDDGNTMLELGPGLSGSDYKLRLYDTAGNVVASWP